MARPIRLLPLDPDQRRELQTMTNRATASQREVWRARIILARADGCSQQQTAELVVVNRPVVVKWEKRFVAQGIAGLAEARTATPETETKCPCAVAEAFAEGFNRVKC